jgi:hypothetical protein
MPLKSMSELVRNLWATATHSPEQPTAKPEVIVHDPEAKLPHDLDDPFFDRKVQSRMADVIAHSGHKK